MKDQRQEYSTPQLKTVDTRQLLEALGPAHCWYGGGAVVVHPGTGAPANGHRVRRVR